MVDVPRYSGPLHLPLCKDCQITFFEESRVKEQERFKCLSSAFGLKRPLNTEKWFCTLYLEYLVETERDSSG